MMTVSELIERLEDFDPDAEVRLAHQPSWPLQFHLGGVASAADAAHAAECDEHGDYNCDDCTADNADVVYLTEGTHPDDSPYAPRGVFDAL